MPLWHENYFQPNAINQSQTHKQQKALFGAERQDTSPFIGDKLLPSPERTPEKSTYIYLPTVWRPSNLKTVPFVLPFLYKCTTLCWKFSLRHSSKELLWVTLPLATHSSVLAWRIPGMGEPGGLPSTGSHRVGHDWSDLAAAAAAFTCLPCCVWYTH